jgi:hypothetical protein
VLDGGSRELVYLDEDATTAQLQALTDAFAGHLGGPLADLAALVGDVIAVQRSRIDYTAVQGHGTLWIEAGVEARVIPYRDGANDVTTLHGGIFSAPPGSPA